MLSKDLNLFGVYMLRFCSKLLLFILRIRYSTSIRPVLNLITDRLSSNNKQIIICIHSTWSQCIYLQHVHKHSLPGCKHIHLPAVVISVTGRAK